MVTLESQHQHPDCKEISLLGKRDFLWRGNIGLAPKMRRQDSASGRGMTRNNVADAGNERDKRDREEWEARSCPVW